MAQQRKQTKKAPPRKGAARKAPPRRKTRRPRSWLYRLLHRPQAEFKPDSQGTGLDGLLHLTVLQRLNLLRWTLYVLVWLAALIIQDTIMSRVSIGGATTDLAVAVLLLLAVIEGCETGSVIALVGSTIYHFTGTAPGAYCVGLITIFGMGAAFFRQKYLHRSAGSIIVCSGAAVIAYEMGVYAFGIFTGVTRWDRIGVFFLTGLLTCLTLIPIHALIYKIGQIGGNTWNE